MTRAPSPSGGPRCSDETKTALRKLLLSLKAQRARSLAEAEKKYEAQLRAVEDTMQLMAESRSEVGQGSAARTAPGEVST